MNDLYFNNKISCFDLLSLISEEKYNVENAEKLLKNYEYMFLGKNEYFDEIFYALKELCLHIKINCLYSNTEKEKSLYPIFDRNITTLSDNCLEVVKIKNNSRHIPDRWVRFEDYDLPVEFKLHSFNISAKEQLRRYIDYYGSKLGIAIGEKLTTELDEDMIFISIDEMKKEQVILDRTTLEKRISGGIKASQTKKIEQLENNKGSR